MIIIPGILGSKLQDATSGRVVWGKIFDLRALTVHESLVRPAGGGTDGLELPISSPDFRANTDGLVPTEIMDSFTLIPHIAEVRVYRTLLESLKVCGYRPGPLQSCGLHTDAAVFAYDWRRDLVESAQALAAMVGRIRENAGGQGPKVDLVAHSMGGLIAEYYLLYGDVDVLDEDPLPPPTYAGAANVRRLILIGTPSQGSLEALRNLHTGYRVALRHVSNLATFTMPALYELLPDRPDVRRVAADGSEVTVDLYDAATWQNYGLGVFSRGSRRNFQNECKTLFPSDWRQRSVEITDRLVGFLSVVLRRAKRFHLAISSFPTRAFPVEVVLIGSASRSTVDSAWLRPKAQGWNLTFTPGSRPEAKHAPNEAPGDGTVTARSFTFGATDGSKSDVQSPFPVRWVNEKHARLPANDEVLQAVAAVLSGQAEIPRPPVR